MYESNNFFEKSLFLLGIYLFDFRTIQAGEYLIDDSLFKVCLLYTSDAADDA